MKFDIGLSFFSLFFFSATCTLAQELPCPPPFPPELAAIVDTPEKCNCFYSLAASGYEPGNSDTFENVFNSESVQNFAQTGSYYGIDGISEYLSYVYSEDAFVTGYERQGDQLLLDFTGSTMEQCVAVVAERRQMSYNPDLTVDNQELCIETIVGAVLYYTLTGDPVKPIAIHKTNAYLPDEIISEAFPYTTSAPAALEYICDVIVNTCTDATEEYSTADNNNMKKKGKKKSKKGASTGETKAPKQNKNKKNGKGTKQSKASEQTDMEKCVEKLKKLPAMDFGALSYIDGNSIGCRVLHSVFARTNPDIHCPHVTFEDEADSNGIFKCVKSKNTLLTDLFTPQQLGMFNVAATMLNLPESGLILSTEACPTR